MAFTAVASENPFRLRHPLTESHKGTESYFPATGLTEAMDVAMLLGQPLLLTGDPGTGKTRAAYWLAKRLGLSLLRYDVKSTSSGTDLLYQFDEVARFRDATRQESRPLVRYLRFNALGEAILRASGASSIVHATNGDALTGDALTRNRELLVDAFGADNAPEHGDVTSAMLVPENKAFATAEPSHCVVLIDELDKAPRDTPNDLLAEIEDMSFRISELSVVVKAESDFRPIVIITSNSEKSLPDPFLRRCAYFDIPFPRRFDEKQDGKWPGAGTLEEIVDGRIDALTGGGVLLEQTLDLFQRLRRPDNGIRKPPGTAELLAWLDALVTRYELKATATVKSRQDVVDQTLCALLKSKEDFQIAQRIVGEWAKPR